MRGKKAAPAAKEPRQAPVQLPYELVRKLRVISAHRGVTQSDMLGPVVRKWIENEYRTVQEEIGSGEKGGK